MGYGRWAAPRFRQPMSTSAARSWCSVPDRTLRVCALYPDLMNIYADRGNLIMLRRRSEWRGIRFELLSADLESRLDPGAADIYYIGGGQDRDQKLCAHDL